MIQIPTSVSKHGYGTKAYPRLLIIMRKASVHSHQDKRASFWRLSMANLRVVRAYPKFSTWRQLSFKQVDISEANKRSILATYSCESSKRLFCYDSRTSR